MSYVPQCYICENFNINNKSCEIHIEGVPQEIINDIKPCENYNPTKEVEDDDLPVAKGR